MRFNLKTVLYALVAFVALAFVYIILVNDRARAEGVSKVPVARAVPAAPASWTGLHIDGYVGAAATSSEIAGFTTLSSDGALGALGAGYDWQVPGSPFAIGVFADWGLRNLGTALGPASVELKGAWTAGGRAGVAVTDKVLVYGLFGWTQTHASTTLAIPDNFDGYAVGGGIEALLSPTFSLGLEGRSIYYNAEHAPIALGGFAWDPTEYQLRVKAAWRIPALLK